MVLKVLCFKDNGIHMFLWFGMALSPEWVQAVFGVPSAAQVNTDDTRLPDLDNALSERVRELIALVRLERHRFMRVRGTFHSFTNIGYILD